MLQLSERLQRIVDSISDGESVVDVGTDHGKVPIALFQRNVMNRTILTDVKEGPLQKARENILRHAPSMTLDLRQGNGLTPLQPGEADVAVIAGMGGRLIETILSDQPVLVKSLKKLILQPRNGQDKLRMFLEQQGYPVRDEFLVREGNFLCEIIVADTNPEKRWVTYQESIDYEISPLLFHKKDALLPEFLKRKLEIETGILEEISTHGNPGSEIRFESAKQRIADLERLLKLI
jgi:tRNA (adenine22-N1)-methyltransferase